MASSQNTQYACRCLNVRITSSAPPSAPPQDLRDRNYIPVFVKDDGISVVHPQVTIRLPSKSVSIPGTPRHSRFTTVCCLFCQLNIYRVYQIILSDVVGGEATLLPTEGWVEHEIMKSASGWIEIHKQSIVEDDIFKAQNSSWFAPSFSLLLPSMSSPPSLPNLIEEEDSPQTPEPSSEATPEYLANMRPIFQLPPFTPSNPVFVHLAAIASRESGQLRATAEGRINDFISAERAGIEAKESELRRQVEVLWKHFRRHLSTVEQERTTNVVNSLRSPIRVKEDEKSLVNGLASPSQLSSSVAIRSFIPQPVSPTSLAPSTSAPRVSALSASLATTRFHHPRHEQQRSSGSGSSALYGSSSSTNKRDSSMASTLIPQQFNQNPSDYLNAQTSYRVLVNEDLVRNKHSQAVTMNKPDGEAAKYSKEAGPPFAGPGVKPTPNGNEKSGMAQVAGSQHSVGEGSEPESETPPSRGRDKGQRKVTFDVEADVVAIPNRRDVNPGEATAPEDPRDMIFTLEDLDSFETDAQHNSLPLIDQPLVRPTKARRPRPPTNGPQEAFSSLRPASLPNPSHMRPMRSQPGVDSSSQGIMLNLPRASGSTDNTSTIPRTVPTSSTPLTENDATLLKLVAADTPSHRGAWTPESRAWQMFTRRQDSKENVVHSNIPENSKVGPTTQSSTVVAAKPVTSKMKLVFSAELDEDDDGDYVDTVPGSLPIQFHSQMQPPEPLTLASYQLTTTVFEESSSPIPAPSNKPLSSAAIRKAAYLARDRKRSMDPGTLDFSVEEEDEDEESEESGPEQGKVEPSDAGGKGRKHALKILQARSELPSDGMWRSLA